MVLKKMLTHKSAKTIGNWRATCSSKVGCVFLVEIRSELRMRQYRDDHLQDTPHTVQIELDVPGLCCKINCSFIRIDFACNEICYVSALGLVQGQIVNIKVILWVI